MNATVNILLFNPKTIGTTIVGATNKNDDNQVKNSNMEQLELTKQWDKVFSQSNKVNHSKITFSNRYGITLAADLYT